MKVSKLVEELNKCHPDTEVVDNDHMDIHFVYPMEAYYDGAPTLLIRDPKKAPYYNVIGINRTSKLPHGKVVLKTLDLIDIFSEDPDAISLLNDEPYDPDYIAEVRKCSNNAKALDLIRFKHIGSIDTSYKDKNLRDFAAKINKDLKSIYDRVEELIERLLNN